MIHNVHIRTILLVAIRHYASEMNNVWICWHVQGWQARVDARPSTHSRSDGAHRVIDGKNLHHTPGNNIPLNLNPNVHSITAVVFPTSTSKCQLRAIAVPFGRE